MTSDYIPTEAEIARAYASRYGLADDKLVRNLLQLIEMHYKCAHDPKFYADKLGISYRHLSRITHSRLKKTPNECLQHRLHEETERLLKFTDLSIKEITYELGICDPSHLNRCFKRITGMSPTKYRAIHQTTLDK